MSSGNEKGTPGCKLVLVAKGRVLIVEDDDAIREAIAEVLREEGYGASEARNGREALELLAEGPPFCVILLDLNMPVMSGQQFLSAVKERAGLPPIVVLTAGVDPLSSEAQLGVTCRIEKPISLDKLYAVLEDICSPVESAR
jgi:CheY-like chemotaxis protein